jgi:hypothetical protein
MASKMAMTMVNSIADYFTPTKAPAEKPSALVSPGPAKQSSSKTGRDKASEAAKHDCAETWEAQNENTK